jgi:hypothetical protein
MPQLTKSLKTRIEELTASVEAQTAELAAYQRVLHIELAGQDSTVVSRLIPRLREVEKRGIASWRPG